MKLKGVLSLESFYNLFFSTRDKINKYISNNITVDDLTYSIKNLEIFIHLRKRNKDRFWVVLNTESIEPGDQLYKLIISDHPNETFKIEKIEKPCNH